MTPSAVPPVPDGVSLFATPAAMAAWSGAVRARGERVAFVPTMGALHEGHVALLREGRRHADRLALSIFVNPTQFAPHEDLARYPRDLSSDLSHAAAAGVDAVFAPDRAAMYPAGHQTTVRVHEIETGMCGDTRPGHFTGVATVVCKLFHIVQPHVAIFGEKDFQQLALIRRMVRDLDMPIEIVGLPTVRDSDGLALSSRNRFLSPEERARAVAIPMALFAARARFASGERDAAVLISEVRRTLVGAVDRIDYVELRDVENLRPLEMVDRAAVFAVAVHIGSTRLIDNVRLE